MKYFQYLAVLALAGWSISWAHGAPPNKPGNNGVPGLKAEIESLQTQLAETESELADTQTELAVTDAELAALEAELAAIRAELAATEADLAAAQAALAATEAELVAERRRFRIPRTGQDECWDASSKDPDDPHFTVHCDLTGQDGDARAGLVPPNVRFTDNDDGSVTDNFTGLVWLRNANCIGSTQPDWETALNLAAALPGTTFPLCGLGEGSFPGDWRVPNVNELMSLVDYGISTSTGTGLPDGHPFIDFDGYYWTSTTFGLGSDQPVAQSVYPCRRKGYHDNRLRFNDAYVVNITTGEVVRLPKEAGANISKRHKNATAGSCVGLGFTSGSPAVSPYAFPTPRFIAVRNAAAN
ncbi:MAG: DUF1566 domain-containing protein [Woeseiaceae bacterium]|nr:DUF1566 domain-containing protein [Woeseiaceae bacterium]